MNFSKRTKPFVRWWWFDCEVTEEEIARELEEMNRVRIESKENSPLK
ncbi:MAG: hypothetical protein N2380_05090 [bacterium]|nr:hypothetical protein [bacterium]